MKKFVRVLLAAGFILANLAIAGAPADAFGGKKGVECVSGDGVLGGCCTSCFFFCDNCAALYD
ncbi:MAG: hypothetical protein RQ745_07110 [Longimicrobiales bacterium]|nr:hypothetical protein [Longimicrobiales bacterium]